MNEGRVYSSKGPHRSCAGLSLAVTGASQTLPQLSRHPQAQATAHAPPASYSSGGSAHHPPLTHHLGTCGSAQSSSDESSDDSSDDSSPSVDASPSDDLSPSVDASPSDDSSLSDDASPSDDASLSDDSSSPCAGRLHSGDAATATKTHTLTAASVLSCTLAKVTATPPCDSPGKRPQNGRSSETFLGTGPFGTPNSASAAQSGGGVSSRRCSRGSGNSRPSGCGANGATQK